MADATTPQLADSDTTQDDLPAPHVSILLELVEGSDLGAALAVVDRQVFQPKPSLVVVGDVSDVPGGVVAVPTLEEAIVATEPETDYLWLLHSDARPRPDALAKLVAEVERNDASLAGSKLLIAGTKDNLESVGSATDVFGEPYSGLEEGEIDLQQYDVVREVAFVSSASMLVRRDLAQGLKGLDVLLPPVAAGLDFSQRARLAGGRVISVPSSEVYHQGRCGEQGAGWREQAGRLRAMVTAYSPLTLLWVIPYDFLVSIVDSVANLLLLRWRPLARHVRSWIWNMYHLPSTIGLRRRLRQVRSTGDEELFRFQAQGSVRLREVGSELSSRVLDVFDEDQALARGSRRVMTSPGIWGAVAAALFILVAIRGFLFSGVPDAGFSFPFEDPSVALSRWFAGWNDTGLGSPNAIHPSVGLVGVVSWVLFGAEGAARTLLTIGFGLFAVIGMGRLGGRLGIRGPGRYLAGIVTLAGPGMALLSRNGSWLALGAAATLPWAVRASLTHPGERLGPFTRYGWATVMGLALASFSPVLALVPLLAVLLWRIWGGSGGRILLGVVVLLAGAVAATAFLIGDPAWVTDADRRLGFDLPPQLAALVGLAMVPLLFMEKTTRRLGAVGGLLSVGGMLAARLPYGGPGVEEAALVTVSFGAALVVAGGLNLFSVRPRALMAMIPSIVILFMSLGVLANGRLGMADDQINERFGFAATLADESGPGRILVASTRPADIPGEARAGPGFWYRLLDGEEMTLDEVWLAEPGDGDVALRAALTEISTGSQLRPGSVLAPFAIDWVVLLGPDFRLDEVLEAQLDLVPTPLDPDSRVYESSSAAPLARTADDEIWVRSGTGFSGDRGDGRVRLAVNFDDGWQPNPERDGWATTVDAVSGRAVFEGPPRNEALVDATVALVVLGMGLIVAGRLRR